MNKLSLTSTFAISTCFLLTSCATPEQKAAQEVARQAAFATAVAESEEKIPDGYSRLTGEALVEFVSDSTISGLSQSCLLYTSPSPRDKRQSRMPSSA